MARCLKFRAFGDLDMLISKDGRAYSVVEFKDRFDARDLLRFDAVLDPREFADFVRFDFPRFDARRKLGRELVSWYRAEFLKLMEEA